MALDINAAALGAFRNVDLGKQDAIANLGGSKGVRQNGELGNFLGKMFRSSGTKEANNAIRTELLKSLGQAFGLDGMGEANGKVTFSKSFMDTLEAALGPAFKRADFGIGKDGTVTSGKPLTQRRINAIAAKVAQMATQATAEAGQTNRAALPEGLQKTALAAGYSKAELPKLASAANFYAEAKGVSVEDAFKVVSKPGTNANRLMNYGGRFLASQSNFTDGLRLIDSFKDWFEGVVADQKKIDGKNYTNDMSLTLLNGKTKNFDANMMSGFEKFVFEEIANNPMIDIASENPEEVFGMANNNATRLFGRHLNQSCTQTLSQIPAEKRTAFFAAFDKFFPLYADNAQKATVPSHDQKGFIGTLNNTMITGRILRHFDAVQQLHAEGRLTTENLVKTCFPEAGKNSIQGVIDLLKKWEAMTGPGDEDLGIPPGKYSDIQGLLNTKLEETGLGIEECAAAIKGGKPLPPAQYISSGTLDLSGFDGTTAAAENQLRGDLVRPTDYGIGGTPQLASMGVMPGFRFTFPGEGREIVANGTTDGTKNIDAVVGKVKTLCGEVHTKQASGVMTMLCQSGMGNLRSGLVAFGITSDEHVSCNYTLSKNETTGAVTIRYESPKEVPFHFSWTATVDTDGNVKTTPLQFMDEAKLTACKTAVNDAIANMQSPSSIHQSHFANDTAKASALIDVFMKGAGGDPDVLNILKDNLVCGSLLYNAANNLRPIEEIQSRVAGVKANVEELREATRGNPLMFKMGVERLKSFAGKPLPKGILTSIVAAANKADIGKLRGLSASSANTPRKFHAAIAQYHAAVSKTISGTNAMSVFNGEVGGEETMNMKMLVGGLVAARCGEASLRAMEGALRSETAGQIHAVYDAISNSENDALGMSGYRANVVRMVSGELDSDMLELGVNIKDALGAEAEPEAPAYDGDPGDLPGAPDVFEDIRKITDTLHADLVERERMALAE